jgi:hypothetical protein
VGAEFGDEAAFADTGFAGDQDAASGALSRRMEGLAESTELRLSPDDNRRDSLGGVGKHRGNSTLGIERLSTSGEGLLRRRPREHHRLDRLNHHVRDVRQ